MHCLTETTESKITINCHVPSCRGIRQGMFEMWCALADGKTTFWWEQKARTQYEAGVTQTVTNVDIVESTFSKPTFLSTKRNL